MSDKSKTTPVSAPSLELLEAELKKEQYRSRYGKVLRSTAFSLVVVAAAAVLIAVLVLPVLQISGSSMTDTLQDGDVVVSISTTDYQTGDIIAFYYNNNILVKRVIATAGDWVDIDEDGNVYVNGDLLDEPYVTEKALGDCNIDLPYQVPDGRCFVMGDHRATSIDSRNTAVGCVSSDMMVGKILFRVWPLSDIGTLN
jgi:signal peptidase I